MKIHDVEVKLGLTKQALIYYEKEGLISPLRDDNNYRHYSQQDIEILQVISFLRSLEISIDEIKLILSGELSLRRCLDNKQNYLNREKDKIERIESHIKEYIKRTKVIVIKENENNTDNKYIRFIYSIDKMSYDNNEISVKDINSIDISLCCSKAENGRYYFIHNLYFIYVDINTSYDTYSIQIMNNSEVNKFFTYLKTLNVSIYDPLNLTHLFEQEDDFMVIHKHLDKNFPKWKQEYNLEMIIFSSSFIEETYIKPFQELKKQKPPSIKEQLKELIKGYIDFFGSKTKLLIKIILFISLTVVYFYLLDKIVNVINLPTIKDDNFISLIGIGVYMIFVLPILLVFCKNINK